MIAAIPTFNDWSPDDGPGYFLAIEDDHSWDDLRRFYTPRRRNAPFEQVIRVAKSHNVRTVFVEFRYIDMDYRDQHASFYGTTFRRHPTVCHRLHFFSAPFVSQNFDSLGEMADAYRGYSVMRPLEECPVGRTVLTPPPRYANSVLCVAEDRTHLLGHEFSVTGMPFMSQDAEYMRCAHVSLWMMMYHAHLRHGATRRLPSHIHLAAKGGMVVGREIPHDGLSHQQILNALHTLDLSASNILLPVTIEKSREDTPLALPQTVCRYINSQMPPMIYNESHAWLAIGYYHTDSPATHDSAQFVCHDDELGPYVEAGLDDAPARLRPWADPRPEGRWMAMIPPLPKKIYITAERAEEIGRERLEYVAERLGKFGQHDNLFVNAHRGGCLQYRTYAVDSRAFKSLMLRERVPDQVRRIYQDAHLSRQIWVVEAVDSRLALSPGAASVVGEAIIDGTAHHMAEPDSPALLARNVGGNVKSTSPDFGETREDNVADFRPYPCAIPNLPVPLLAL